ncbi:MAG: class I poly(R)-hydroxyalkanoic acid synthase, partial [Rhodobacterales bacterium 17-64-5]
MTTADKPPETDVEAEMRLARLNENLAKLDGLSKRLTTALAQRRQTDLALNGPAPEVFLKAAAAYLAEMMQNPSRLVEHQVSYWGKTLKHYVEAQQVLAKGKFLAPPDPFPADRRFQNPLWETHPFCNYLKQQYQRNAEAVTTAVNDMEVLDPADRKRVDYFTRQIVDMMSPTNFLATNPDALEKAVATDGMSLVQGLENLVRDIESHQGDLVVTLADQKAFKVGENLATTPGEVVYRNPLIELIQYAPTTPKVHKTPLILFPPWINKFYILDLKPANSLIKWIVDQGFTLF